MTQPKPQQLSSAQKSALTQASRTGAQLAFARLPRYAAKSRWLAERNPYARNIVGRLKAELSSGGAAVHSKQAADYVAASAPLHAFDGWNFLGRAMASHLHGDGETALHLAYYAELRAAMALMATQGIGILNQQHLLIGADGFATALPGRFPTHPAAWAFMEEWAHTADAVATLASVIQPGGRSIDLWISSLASGASWAPVATEWLLTLGLDLQHFALDQYARNEASYRPSRLREGRPLRILDATMFSEALWSLLEPLSSGAPFALMDRYLLRFSLDRAFRATTGFSPAQASSRFRRDIEGSVRANSGYADALSWQRFLLRESDPTDPAPFRLCRERAVSRANPWHHMAVMSRAVLLLRLASGAVRHALTHSGVSFSDLDFWWSRVGLDRGLWSTTPVESSLVDLWADTALALETMSEWTGAGPDVTFRGLLQDAPEVVICLGQLEAVGLWSLAS